MTSNIPPTPSTGWGSGRGIHLLTIPPAEKPTHTRWQPVTQRDTGQESAEPFSPPKHKNLTKNHLQLCQTFRKGHFSTKKCKKGSVCCSKVGLHTRRGCAAITLCHRDRDHGRGEISHTDLWRQRVMKTEDLWHWDLPALCIQGIWHTTGGRRREWAPVAAPGVGAPMHYPHPSLPPGACTAAAGAAVSLPAADPVQSFSVGWKQLQGESGSGNFPSSGNFPVQLRILKGKGLKLKSSHVFV